MSNTSKKNVQSNKTQDGTSDSFHTIEESSTEVASSMHAAIQSTASGVNNTANIVNSVDEGQIYSSMENSEISVATAVQGDAKEAYE